MVNGCEKWHPLDQQLNVWHQFVWSHEKLDPLIPNKKQQFIIIWKTTGYVLLKETLKVVKNDDESNRIESLNGWKRHIRKTKNSL